VNSKKWYLPIMVALMGLTGCADFIPGINLHEKNPGTHEYQVVSDQEPNHYKVVESAPVPKYEIVPITPDVLVQLAKEEDSHRDDLDNLPSLLPSNVPPEYRLGPGDVFFVVVWDHPELTAPYTGLTQDLTSQGRLVASDGTAFFPYVGTFKAAGMTAGDVRNYLAERLKKVVQNPQVDVRIVAYRAGRVEVTGEVNKPGTLNFDDTPKGVLQAIDACGGLTGNASRRRAILVRNGVLHQIDLADLLSGTHPVANPELLPGDVLHIPDQSGDQVFVLGEVGRQTPVQIPQDSLSLARALSTVGGIDDTKGKAAGLLVFRPHRLPDSEVEARVFTLDLTRPEGMLLASQFKLEPRDVVYIKATAFYQFNSIINELLPTVTTIYELNSIHQFIK
jgi:polysaccharide biosynthesis/export protein